MQFICNLLNLENKELKPTFLLCILSTAAGFVFVIMQATSNSLFLTHYGADNFAYILLVTGLINILLGLILEKIRSRFADTTMYLSISIFLIAMLCSYYLSLVLFHSKITSFLMMSSVGIIDGLQNIVFLSLAYKFFNIRQGKRIFPLIGSGRNLAVIIGGGLIPFFLLFINVKHLLALAGVSSIIFFLVLTYIVKLVVSDKREKNVTPTKNNKISFISIVKSPLISILFLSILIGSYAYDLTQYIFYNSAQIKFPAEKELADFFGIYYSVLSACILFTNLFITGRVIEKVGVGIGITTLPGVYMLSISGMTAYYLYTHHVNFIFITLTIFLFSLISCTFNRSARRLLTQPFNAEKKSAIAIYMNSYLEPIATLLSATILFFMTTLYKVDQIYLFGILLMSAFIWLSFALKLKSRYVVQLQTRLCKRADDQIYGESIIANDYKSFFIKSMQSNNPGEVLFSYHKLKQIDPDFIDNYIQNLLSLKKEEYLLEGLGDIMRLGRTGFSAQVTDLIETQLVSDEVKALAVKTILNQTHDIDKLKMNANIQNNLVKKEILIGYLQSANPKYIAEGENTIKALIRTDDIDNHILAAKLIGDNNDIQYLPLLNLLPKEDVQVKHEVLINKAKFKDCDAIEDLLIDFTKGNNNSDTRAALLGYGDVLLKYLDRYFAEEPCDFKFFKKITRLILSLKTKCSTNYLYLKLPYLNLRRHDYILLALASLNYKTDKNKFPEIECKIIDEFKRMLFVSHTMIHITNSDEFKDLFLALKTSLDDAIKRVVSYITLKHSKLNFSDIYTNLMSSDSSKVALAIEFLDSTLTIKDKTLLLSILENRTPENIIKHISKYIKKPTLDLNQCFSEILSLKSDFNVFVKSNVLYLLGKQKNISFVHLFTKLLESKSWIIRQTAGWALLRTMPNEIKKYSNQLCHDSHPQIKKYFTDLNNIEKL
jgi:AAA family ATP:ADP antiporter